MAIMSKQHECILLIVKKVKRVKKSDTVSLFHFANIGCFFKFHLKVGVGNVKF
jgi:hypothetical protein